MSVDSERTADDGQVRGVLFRIVGIDRVDQTKRGFICQKHVQHARCWRPYRAKAFETNPEEYPCEGISFPGGSKLRCEKGMKLVQRSLIKETVLCLRSISRAKIGFSRKANGSQSRADPFFPSLWGLTGCEE